MAHRALLRPKCRQPGSVVEEFEHRGEKTTSGSVQPESGTSGRSFFDQHGFTGYTPTMRGLILLALLPVLAVAEELPDTAPPPVADEERGMAERFSGGTSMNASEMEALFLESPTILEDPESRHSADARTREEREKYSEREVTRMLLASQYRQSLESSGEQDPHQDPTPLPLPILLEEFFEKQFPDMDQFHRPPSHPDLL